MAIVEVSKNIYEVDSLYQWDKNQVLEIQGLSLHTIPEIHFTNDAMDRAIVRQATMDDKGIITVEVPNSLLQKHYKITVYVCIYEDKTFKSLYKFVIPIKARKKPTDYTIEANDNEIYSFNAIENLVNNTLVVLTQKCDDTIAETETIKNTAIAEMNDIKTNTIVEMNNIKTNIINEATELKNETIEECERIKEEIMNTSYDALAEDIEELRSDFDNHVIEMTPISQIVEGSTKPITSGAVHSLKSEIDESLENLSLGDWTFVDSKTGTSKISIPSNAKELFIKVRRGTSEGVIYDYNIPICSLDESEISVFRTFYATSTSFHTCRICLTNSYVYIHTVYSGNTTNIANESMISMWYR